MPSTQHTWRHVSVTCTLLHLCSFTISSDQINVFFQWNYSWCLTVCEVVWRLFNPAAAKIQYDFQFPCLLSVYTQHFSVDSRHALTAAFWSNAHICFCSSNWADSRILKCGIHLFIKCVKIWTIVLLNLRLGIGPTVAAVFGINTREQMCEIRLF